MLKQDRSIQEWDLRMAQVVEQAFKCEREREKRIVVSSIRS